MTAMNNRFDVVIEISAESNPVKYEFDKEAKMLRVDRIMPTSMVYPCNYGFIPNTIGGDGDPIDVLLHSSYPVQPGAIINARAIGALQTEDEGGSDLKVLALPNKKVDPFLASIDSLEQLPQAILDRIEHFFEYYKKLEQGKWVKVSGWISADEAMQLIVQAAVTTK